MSFISPYFLIGAAAASIPLLIHLLTRDRIKKVQFSSLRFFVRTSGAVLKRKKAQEMIILAMRMAFCALLAIAFARPFFGDAGVNPDGTVRARNARVVLVDVSASVGTAANVQAKAKAAVSNLDSGSDAVAVVAFTNDASVLQAMTTDLGKANEAIDSIQITSGGTDLLNALQRAVKLLDATSAEQKSIVIVSDLQRSGWRNYKGVWKLPPDVQLHVQQVHDEPPANVAIVETDFPQQQVPDGKHRSVSVRVANYSQKRFDRIPVALTIHGKVVETQTVSLMPRDSVPVRFRCLFDKVGDNPSSVSIDVDDYVAEDNAYYFNTRVVPKIKILVITSQIGDDSFYLVHALDPPGSNSPFSAVPMTASQVTPNDVESAMVVILSDVSTLNANITGALRDLLGRGGGLFFVPGDSVRPDKFNQTFAAIAPAKLRQQLSGETRAKRIIPVGWQDIDYEHPVFEVFKRPHHGDLKSQRFFRFWEVSDSQLSRVLARLENGMPALLEQQIDKGISMMFVSALDGNWNNLPVESGAIFVSLLHQTMQHLAVRSKKRTQYNVGEPLEIKEGYSLLDPSGKTMEDATIRRPGFHSLKNGKSDLCVAANIDLTEADPAPLNVEEITAAIVPAGSEAVQEQQGAAAVPPEAEKNSIWWFVILGASVLILGELFLSNRALRH